MARKSKADEKEKNLNEKAQDEGKENKASDPEPKAKTEKSGGKKDKAPDTKAKTEKEPSPARQGDAVASPDNDDMERMMYIGDTINHFDFKGIKYRLFPNKIVMVPMDAPQVERLVMRGYLIEPPEEK